MTPLRHCVGLSDGTVCRADVLPYYLHQLDPVAGAAHFAVDDPAAQSHWWQRCTTTARLSGATTRRGNTRRQRQNTLGPFGTT